MKNASLARLTLDGVDLVFEVDIDNPYAVPLPLRDVTYTVTVGGEKLFAGNVAPNGSIPARASKTIEMPASVPFRSLFAAIKNVRPGKVLPYRAEFSFGIDVPIAGRMVLPASYIGEFPIPTVPDVSLVALDVGSVSFDKIEARARVKIRNTNEFDVDLSTLGFGLGLAGKEVARSNIAPSVRLKPGESAVIELPMSFSPRRFGSTVFDLLRGSSTPYEAAGTLDLGTRFGPLRIPFRDSGETTIY